MVTDEITEQGSLDPTEIVLRQAEVELEKVRTVQQEAREALARCDVEVRKWERVIATLRPPEVAEKPSRRGPRGVLELPKREIADSTLDMWLERLREHFKPGEQFLTADAAAATGCNPGYMVKLLQEMRVRGEVRLAGRAPGKGVIPLFALVPERQDESEERD